MPFSKDADQVLSELKTDANNGLSEQEAKSRLEQFGPNKLIGKPKKSFIVQFFMQLKDMLIYVLLGAAVITFIVGEYVDAIIILLVVFMNAGIGLFQEFKAEKAMEALQQMTVPISLVKRDGSIREIESANLVPGDIVVLEAGRFVPADLRLIEIANLQIEESALTGESLPVIKELETSHRNESTSIGDRTNMAFMSTLVTYGRGEGVVTGTGMNTEIGKIAKSLDAEGQSLTPLQIRMEELGKTLGYIAIGICVLIFVISAIQGRDLFDMFLTSISLAVAAIPEGLPAILAIVLALGVTRMSKNKAIIKKLPAVETLGSVNVICTDKTGTLTQNKMTVVKSYTYEFEHDVQNSAGQTSNVEISIDEQMLIHTMMLCSDATYKDGEGIGDPTEIALLMYGDLYQITREELFALYPRKGELPFDSDRKLMSTLNRNDVGYRVHTKGALDQLLKCSTHVLVQGKIIPLSDEVRTKFEQAAESMSKNALRVLGASYKDTDRLIQQAEMEEGLVLIGIVGMIDPPRQEVKDAIQIAKVAGIKPVMITGDHKQTAFAIAEQLGIANSIEQCITGAELDQWSDEQWQQHIETYTVFSRVSPEHKVKIVKAFKARGNIVSMTGDGVNDAPSLKGADIGVAMGITGTDVSKGAADMILTDDNYTTIIRAIEEGRNIYNNIKKSVIFLLSCNLGEIIAILVAVSLFWPVPLLVTQLLWINLITDTLPAIALGVDPGEKNVMKRKPRPSHEGFFAGGAGIRAIIGGLLVGAMTLVAFCLSLYQSGYAPWSDFIPSDVLDAARTMAFLVLAVSQLLYSLSMRSSSLSILQVGIFSNRYLVGAIVLGILLQVGVIYIPWLANAFHLHPLTMLDWVTALLLSCVPLLLNELLKRFKREV